MAPPAPRDRRPDPADVELAVALVRDAGRLALRMRGAGALDTTRKTSVSDVVTAADHAAERLVLERLAALRPDDGVLGEEGAERVSRSGRTWVVDPVDGTYNFVRGLTGWCSALALVEGDPSRLDAALLGAVHHPHDDTTWVGGPALPSTRDGVALDPVVDRTLDQACVATYRHPPTHATPAGLAWSHALAPAATVRMLGSGSMDAALAAGGVVDVVVQHSVPDWDRLPGEALLRGVGGVARLVEAAGRRWYVAGAPSAVAEVCDRLAEAGAGAAAPGR